MIASTLSLAALERRGERTFDALVVGAGPAGALAARELARRGAAVLLVDRAHFPRSKVCGACLGPAALRALEQAGLAELIDAAHAPVLDQVALCFGARRVRLALPHGRVLSRSRLDAALVQAAVDAGCELVCGARAELGPIEGDARVVLLRAGELEVGVRARVVLAADGLASELLRSAGVAFRTARASRIGAGASLPSPSAPAPSVGAPLDDAWTAAGLAPRGVTMVLDRAGYVGLVRLEDGALDLAAALDPRHVRTAGGPAELVAHLLARAHVDLPAVRALEWRGTPTLTRRPAQPFAERVLALGDAAGYVEPFTGEGIAWALASARELAPLAAPFARGASKADFGALARAWERARRASIGRRQLACRAVAALLRRPALFGGLATLLARSPGLAAPAVRLSYGENS